MGLTNLFPAGSKLLAGTLNQTVPFGVEYEQRTTQTITNATDTKLKFETPVQTNSDVVASGTGNTDFALNRVGLWLVTTAVRYLGNAGGLERHIFVQTGTAFDTAKRIAYDSKGNVGAAPVTVTCSRAFRISTPTSVFAAGFQNAGASVGTDIAFGHTNHISLTWLGP